jgi:hypothetical protein
MLCTILPARIIDRLSFLDVLSFSLCLFMNGDLFYVPLKNFSLIWRHHHIRWRAANLDLCLELTSFRSEGSFTCHTNCDTGPPFLRSYPKDPWFYLLSAVLLAKEQWLPILNVLGLTRAVRAGLQFTTYLVLSKSSTTRLRQPAGSYFLRKCRNNIQISSSHTSSTDVIFTEVFDATLDIDSVYNMLFWSPTFYH